MNKYLQFLFWFIFEGHTADSVIDTNQPMVDSGV